MQNIFLNGIQNVGRQLKEHRSTFKANKEYIPPERKGKFIFEPKNNQTIQEQLDNFYQMIKKHKWDKKLSIKGYKGTFKVEHWITIETNLRALQSIRELSFIDTQIDKEHLIILKRWIQWIKPDKLCLEFQQNEIDDEDLEEFVFFLFERKIDLKRLYIISNPGVYKGQLLKRLKQYLNKQKDQSDSSYYQMIKNKDSKSFAIAKYEKQWSDITKNKVTEEVFNKINQTCFYNLSLAGCYTEQNYLGFEHLLQLTYDLDNLEQISGLNISSNYIGTLNSFTISCQHLSTAKGLLELRMKENKYLQYSSVARALMGNRYDKLRVNVLDFSQNSDILEKTFQLYSNEIFLDCKEVLLNQSLNQQLSTLYKLSVYTEAFQQQCQVFQQQFKKGIKSGNNFIKFDLSTIENYNRHDLVEKFLKNVVFNQFSRLKELTVQNLDIGRMKAYTTTIQKFREDVKILKNTHPQQFKNFVLPLQTITLPNQTYRMEPPTIKEFFKEFFFTKEGDILQIKTFNMIKCFRQNGREEGLLENCDELYKQIQENVDVGKFTIKNIKIEDTTCDSTLNVIRLFLFTTQFNIESFSIISDSLKCSISEILAESTLFFQKQPQEFIHSLQSITLNNLSDYNVDIADLLELFVYTKQFQLKKLDLTNFKILIKDNSFDRLDKLIYKQVDSFSLESLRFGEFEDTGCLEFFKYVILTKFSKLKQLNLDKMNFHKISDQLQLIYQELQSNDIFPINHLEQFKINNVAMETENDWRILATLFIVNAKQLKMLSFNQINLDQNFITAVGSATIEKIQQLNSVQQNQQALHLSKINQLEFIKCQISVDFLSIFLPYCEIESLEITGIENIEKCLEEMMNIYTTNNLNEVNFFQMKSFKMSDCKLSKENTFQWLIQEIVLNQDRQQLNHLTFENCDLSDPLLDILSQQIKFIKDKATQTRRYYNIRSVNLNNNKNISEKSWKKFFDILFEQKRKIQPIEKKAQQESGIESGQIDNDNPDSIILRKEEIQTLKNDQQDDNQILENKLKEEIESVSNQNHELAFPKALNIESKIYSNFQIFKPSFPKQLQQISFNMLFDNVSEANKTLLYYNFIIGLIVNPESKLNKIKLTNVDLTIFMSQFNSARQFAGLIIDNGLKQEKADFKLKLEELEFESTKGTVEDSEQFVQTFLFSNHVQLKTLILLNFKEQKVISQILKLLNIKDNNTLENIKIKVYEVLTELETFSFVKNIWLTQKLQLKSLEITGDFILTDTMLEELKFDLSPLKLEKISIQYPQAKLTQVEPSIIKLISLLVENKCKLKSFEMLDIMSIPIQGAISAFNKYEQQLEEITISGKLELDDNFFKFLGKTISTLKTLKLTNMNCDQTIQFENIITPQQQRIDSVLDVKVISGSQKQEVISNFIYNSNFGFERIILRDATSFTNFQLNNNCYENIKSLKLDFGLLYNSSTQLEPKSLTLLAQKFIYNESSQLEDLQLLQCHLKIAGVKALIEPAASFRNQIINEGRTSTALLKLKSIIIYYSLYLGDDGHDLLIRDLIFFEYLNVEKIIVQVTNFNDNNCNSLTKGGKDWLQFQKQHNRKQQVFPLKYLDIGRNEFVQQKESWSNYLNTFAFSDQCPYLETFNIHFMAINDIVTEYIVAEILSYLNSKPKNFKSPIKKINFSQNNSLSKIGWTNIFTNFFLHPKIDLIELNMISTMLDSSEKLFAIYYCFEKRAKMERNKKLPMQIFLCYNVSLKDMIFPFITTPPENYQAPKDLPVAIDYQSWKFGHFDGIPEEKGDIVLMQNRVMALRNEFIDTNKLKTFEDVKFPIYFLNFTQHYLQILNNYYSKTNQQKGKQVDIFFNLKTLNNLTSIFQYSLERPGTPYPFKLLFQQDFYNYLKNRDCYIYDIYLIQSEFPSLEIIDQFDVFEIWKQVKDKRTSLNKIQVEYYLNDDLVEKMLKEGYTERDIISLIRMIPPKSIRLEGGLSLPAVKGLYSILYDSPTFQYSIINYDFDTFLNTGIGYALREQAYTFDANNSITDSLKYMFYWGCNFFVQKSQKYKFDNEILQLNQYLSKQKLYFFIIAFMNILYLVVTIILPYIFTHYVSGDSTSDQKSSLCKNGTSPYSNYIYYGFALISFFVEAYLFYQIQLLIPSHIEKFEVKVQEEEKEDDQIEGQKSNKVAPVDFQKQVTKKISKTFRYFQVKTKEIAESKWGELFNHLLALVLSQLYKFDLYNDIAFILTCYYCEEKILFILTILITSITQGIYFIYFLYLIFVRLTQTDATAKIISTKFINDIYAIAFLGRNQALTNQLDRVAPYNVSIIPNNWLTRRILPKQAGRSMGNPIKAYFMQFICEDLPQTILYAYFVVKRAIMIGYLSPQVYLTIITSIYNFISSFFLFMSIRPTTLSQNDFDQLSKLKVDEYHQVKLNQLNEEKKQLQLYSQLYQNSGTISPVQIQDQELEHLL